MKLEDLLPFLMLSESIVAAGIYAAMGEWTKAWYWLSGASITLCVLRMQNSI